MNDLTKYLIASLLLENENKIIDESPSVKKLRIFDFDDTLAHIDAKIYITHSDGSKESLTPAEYAVYESKPGDTFNFKEFSSIIKKASPIKSNIDLLIKSFNTPNVKTTILTARLLGYPVVKYLKDEYGIRPYVVGLGSSDPEKKREWIEQQIEKGYNDIKFMDDSAKNINAVSKLKEKYPNVKLELKLINEGYISKQPSDFKEALKSLTKYMIDQGMNIKPLPRVISVSNDSKNAENILGKTAYYNPNNCSITLFTLNRHPKDILRSYAHEMIHRMQDNEGRLNNVNTTNTNEDDSLEELEKEAYLKGNITFRNWEDSIKNVKPLNEGRYDTISNRTSSMIFNKWKQDFEKGKKQGNLTTIIKNDDVEFNLKATIEFRNSGKTIVDGGLLEKNDEFTIFANFKVNKNKLPQEWSEISMGLKDVIRHEIEHITQANPETSKFIDDEVDQLTRDSINSKLLPLAYYFKLEKEVDANLQGMYFRAKKEKRPFIDVINDYLDGQNITPKQKEEIITLWRSRAKALSLPEF